MRPSDPHPLDFDDYRAYLREWFERRAGHPSQRGFADQVHCSPSLVTHVLKGRRPLDADRARRWHVHLGLEAERAELFVAMVESEDGPDAATRLRASDRVRAARHFREGRKRSEATAALYSKWWIPAVNELAQLPGFRPEASWISGALCPSITEAQAQEALETLLDLGLLRRTERGVEAGEGPLLTDHEVTQKALAAAVEGLHRELDGLSSQALRRFDVDRRVVGAVTFAADQDAFDDVRGLVETCQRAVIERAGRVRSPDRVLQLTFRLFPLTASEPNDPADR